MLRTVNISRHVSLFRISLLYWGLHCCDNRRIASMQQVEGSLVRELTEYNQSILVFYPGLQLSKHAKIYVYRDPVRSNMVEWLGICRAARCLHALLFLPRTCERDAATHFPNILQSNSTSSKRSQPKTRIIHKGLMQVVPTALERCWFED